MGTLAVFVFESILLGVGLAMDAFSVSMANGLQDPGMSVKRRFCIAGTFAGFQFLMPVAGWFCVRTVAEQFVFFQRMIPWIAFVLLGFIGGKMVLEGIRHPAEEEEEEIRLAGGTLLLQGVATSIDALSVGFTIAKYDLLSALTEAVIIGAVTFGICVLGVKLGKRLGLKLAGKASVFGGIILILIGLEIFITGVF